MKKQLAIIELETHASLLEKWYLLLKDMAEFDFCFYLHPKVKSKLSGIPEDKILITSSFKNIPIEKYHLIIVNTFHRHFKEGLNILQNTKSVVVLHNLNFSVFFNSVSLLNLFTTTQFLYFLKLYFKERVLRDRKYILRAKNTALLSENCLFTLLEKMNLPNSFFLNFNYCKAVKFIRSEEILIVIPGNISSKRKDLNLTFRVLSKLKPVSKLHFVFLGKPENKSILKRIQKLVDNSLIKITYFESYVPQKEYNYFIEKAHVLFCPIKEKTSFYGVTEVYGKTKVSGNENDCIYNGKIGLFPKTYPQFNWFIHNYSNEKDLKHYFDSLTLEDLEIAYNKVSVLAKTFTFEKIQDRLRNQLLRIIEN